MSEKSISILIIEDSRTQANIIRGILKKEFPLYEIYHVLDPFDGYHFLMTYDVCAVILDFNMPLVNGNLLLKKMQLVDELKGIPVIVSSGEKGAIKANELGAVGTLLKPYKPHELVDLLEANIKRD
jgi:DNA-binding NtrC family response regulator